MKVRFVRDEATSNDFFGGHRKIAETLIELIDHPDRLRLIGVLGSWGSGKSTVLKIAGKKLADPDRKPETIVFTFDAWMHQSDPPRRAFIESFIQFLVGEKICPNESWEEELADVQRRIETHEINSTPTLSPWGVGIAVSLLLLPLGIRLTGETGWLGALGWPFVAAPFVIAAANWWWWRPVRNFLNARDFFRQKNFLVNRHPYEKRSITSILVNKSTDKTTNRILKTPEPTSIEFRKNFSSILKKISSSGYKFVFVLDNLDRIPSEDALNIWSTFRSLFSTDDKDYHKYGIDFCVVIPLDYFSLQKLYPAQGSTPEENSERVQSLIDKSFDIILRVGPPVQSDWADYLEHKLKYATFDAVTDSEIYEARTLFRSYLEHKSRTSRVTPRDINSYVNNIAIIWSQRQGETSFSAICYFACFSAQGEEFDVNRILLQDAPAASVVSRLDSDWQTGVAAIHFGVDSDKALQLLVGDKIVAAIIGEDAPAFSKLEAIPGFEGVLEQLLRSGDERPPSFYAALAGLLPDFENASITGTKTWDIVASSVAPASGWDRLSALTAQGLGRIVERQGKASAVPLIVSLSAESPGFEQAPEIWLANVSSVLKAGGGEVAQLKGLYVPFGADYYLATLSAADSLSLDKNVYAALKPAAGRESVISELAQKLKTNGFDQDGLQTVQRLQKIDGSWAWGPIFEACKETLEEGEDIDAATGALTALVMLGSHGTNALKELGLSGHLADAFNAAWEGGDDSDVGAALGAIANGWPDIDISSHHNESAAGESLLKNLDDLNENDRARIIGCVPSLMSYYPATTLEGLVRWAIAHPNSSKTLYAAARDTIGKGLATLVNTANMAEMSASAVASGNKDAAAIIRFCAFSQFWKTCEKVLSAEQLANVALSVGVSSIKDEDVPYVTKKIVEQDEEFWMDVIQNKPNILRMTDALLAEGRELDLGGGLRRAYNTYFTSVAGGALSALSLGVSWPRLVDAAQDSGSEAVNGLLDTLTTVDNESRLRVLGDFDEDFLAHKIVVALGDRIANVLLIPLLIDEDDKFPEAVLEIDTHIAPISKRFRKPTKLEITSKLKKLVEREIITEERAEKLHIMWNLEVVERKRAAPKSPAKRARAKPKSSKSR